MAGGRFHACTPVVQLPLGTMLCRVALLVALGTPRVTSAQFTSAPSTDSPRTASRSPLSYPTAAPDYSPPATAGAATLAAPKPTGAPELVEEIVQDVVIVGNTSTPAQKVLNKIGTRKGRPFDQTQYEKDVRLLASKGWFLNVRPKKERVPGGVVVTFEVVERAKFQFIKYVGNKKIKTKTLVKETGMKKGDPADPYAVEEARKKIETYYQTKGYNNVRVTVFEGDKVGDSGVVFMIHEGPVQKILKVNIVGAEVDTAAHLRTVLQSKPPILYLFRGYLDRQKVDEDVERLTEYYRSLGFFKARVGRTLDYNEDRNWVTLTFVVNEGPRYKVRDIKIVGNVKIDADKLLEGTKLKPGDYFNQPKLMQDKNLITDAYGGIGHIFANVEHEQRFLEEPGQLDLIWRINEGDRYRIGDITVKIEGESPHTRHAAVLNRLGVRPGDIADIRKFRDAERRLAASSLFKVDPASGVKPKIVFSPPNDEGDGGRPIAKRPGQRSTIRGQSPDRQIGITLNTPPLADDLPDVNDQPASRAASPARGADERPAQRSSTPPLVNQAPLIRGQSPGGWRAPIGGIQPNSSSSAYGGVGAGQTNPNDTNSSRSPRYGASAAPVSDPTNPSTYRAGASSGVSNGGSTYGGQQPYAGQSPYVAAPPPNQDSPLYVPRGGFSTAPSVGEQPPLGDNYVDPNYVPPDKVINPEILIQETQTGRFMFGVGVNSDAGVVGSIVIDEQNFDWRRFPSTWEEVRSGQAFRGAGQRFRLEAAPGTQVQRYLVNFMEPYLLDTPVSLGLSAFYYTRIFRDWQESRLGGRASLGYQFTPDLSGNVSFGGQEVQIRNPRVPTPTDLQRALGSSQLYTFGASVAHDTRDSTFLATQGHYIRLDTEYNVGTFQFPRSNIDARKYFTLRERPDGTGRHVLTVSGRLGVSGRDTPIFERYFAGGFSSLRGFQFRGVGPTDLGVHVGGDFELVGSFEYLFPITADDMLRGVAFVDYGTVEPDVSINKFRVAPGAGLRITIPAMGPAPIALDFAFPITKDDSDIRQIFSFFVGFGR